MAPVADLPLVTSAAEALDRYEFALSDGRLIQADWHDRGADGRWLACALGVLGDEVGGPRDCPASVMPTWLAQTVPYFFDNLPADAAKDWGLRFYRALALLGGDVPFTAYHRWMADCVLPTAAAAARATPGADDAVTANETMIALHDRAAAGDLAPEGERSAAWFAAWSAAARSAAWSAARSAAWSAAESAAWSAAQSAAWSAARSAAWSAAESAAWSAAQSAAWSAAESAAVQTMADGLVSAMLASA